VSRRRVLLTLLPWLLAPAAGGEAAARRFEYRAKLVGVSCGNGRARVRRAFGSIPGARGVELRLSRDRETLHVRFFSERRGLERGDAVRALGDDAGRFRIIAWGSRAVAGGSG